MSIERNTRNHADGGQEDPAFTEAIRNFRASVHAWSEAAYNRPRPAIAVTHRTIWRRSAAWVLGLVLSLGIVGTAAWEHHHQNQMAQQREQLEREQQHRKQLDEQRTAVQQVQEKEHVQEPEDLMARVDSDVSREVPAAMEPLAQLMTDDDIR